MVAHLDGGYTRSDLGCHPGALVTTDICQRLGTGAGRGRGRPRRRAGGRADRTTAGGSGGDRLDGWPTDMRILVRRETNRGRPPVVAVRAGQRPPLPAHRDQRHGRAAPAASRPGIGCTPAWGVHPLRQEHRPGPLAVALVRDQHRLDHRRRYRNRPAVLEAAAAAAGPLAKAEPAILRYRLLHAAARLVKRSRHLILRIPETWPWAEEFAAAVNRVRAIPCPPNHFPYNPKKGAATHRGRGTRRHRTTRGAAAYAEAGIKISSSSQQPSGENSDHHEILRCEDIVVTSSSTRHRARCSAIAPGSAVGCFQTAPSGRSVSSRESRGPTRRVGRASRVFGTNPAALAARFDARIQTPARPASCAGRLDAFGPRSGRALLPDVARRWRRSAGRAGRQSVRVEQTAARSQCAQNHIFQGRLGIFMPLPGEEVERRGT